MFIVILYALCLTVLETIIIWKVSMVLSECITAKQTRLFAVSTVLAWFITISKVLYTR